jgi:hypothetical protein
MHRRGFDLRQRLGATLTLAAFLVVVLGATAAFAAKGESPGEGCAGCPGCESGQCRDEAEHPLESHHHCCTTCCLAHASLALSAAQTDPAPVVAGPLAASRTLAVLGRSQDAPYRPPRS